MRVTKKVKEEYESLLQNIGEGKFFEYIFKNGVIARKHIDYPENMMLDQSEAFFSLFRSSGNYNYFVIGRILRRISHKLYRYSRRQDPLYPINNRFLDIIR